MENVSLLLFLFHVSTYALFYKAENNQSQKETNVPYPTPNQTKLVIFTKHSNGSINTSCCGYQGSSPKTRTGVLATSQTKTWLVRAHPSRRSSNFWNEHFRIHKDIFLRLVHLVAPEISQRDIEADAISPPKRVAIALWRLAGSVRFRDIATHFDVGKSTCVTITKEFCQALNRLTTNYIKFP